MPFADVLDELGIPWAAGGESRHVTAGWLGVDCPRCSPGSGKFKAGLPVGGARNLTCWSCGKIRLIDFLVEAAGITWKQAHSLLADLDSNSPPRVSSGEPAAGRLVLPPGLEPMGKLHRSYLRGRGFDPEELERTWGLRGIGLARRRAWSVFVPVEKDGMTVSFTTRQCGDHGKRYDSAGRDEEAFPHKALLFGEGKAGHAVVVVEGPFDAFRVGPGAVATFGTVVTEAQVARLARFPKRTIIFDEDPQAQRNAQELADLLEAFPGRTLVARIDAADPGSAKPREVRWIRKRFLEV